MTLREMLCQLHDDHLCTQHTPMVCTPTNAAANGGRLATCITGGPAAAPQRAYCQAHALRGNQMSAMPLPCNDAHVVHAVRSQVGDALLEQLARQAVLAAKHFDWVCACVDACALTHAMTLSARRLVAAPHCGGRLTAVCRSGVHTQELAPIQEFAWCWCES